MFKNSILICIFFLTSLHEEAQSLFLNSTACNPQDCGNGVKISFPFWIPSKQQPYCGLPSYNITCDHDHKPLIKIHSEDYIVRNIFYSNNSIILVTPEVYNEECPVPKHNFSLEMTPFRYGPNTADLMFFYNCTEPYGMETYPAGCASNATHHSFAVFGFDLMEHGEYSVNSCQPPVNTPVEIQGISKLLELSYSDVLKKGFTLQWNESLCRFCEESGGQCGYSIDHFVCFCHNKTQKETCPQSPLSLGSEKSFNFSMHSKGDIESSFGVELGQTFKRT